MHILRPGQLGMNGQAGPNRMKLSRKAVAASVNFWNITLCAMTDLSDKTMIPA